MHSFRFSFVPVLDGGVPCFTPDGDHPIVDVSRLMSLITFARSSTTVNLPPQAPFPNRKRRPMKVMISNEDNFVPKRRLMTVIKKKVKKEDTKEAEAKENVFDDICNLE
ncbi:unnamed protein product [Cylicocyclus nassatus]|uniref:Uncharacterized protein n=1 Tax=Cylicocyclus nassatus TaxID=53992 RepID=A0AA36DNK6_CYLNA|nr:unnamed protein product [Cylicocyclus nassatus]